MPSSAIVLLCINVFAGTFTIGGFAPLLPEMGRGLRLSDLELGVLAGSFGFARMIADVPVGFVVRRHPRPALVVGPLILLAGILCMAAGGPFATLLLGRTLMGLGHSLGMVAILTAVLHVYAGKRLGAALNAIEFSGMLGLLGGVTLVGWMPRALAWNGAFLAACSPVILLFLTLPQLLASLREEDRDVRSRAVAASTATAAGRTWLVPVVFVTGAALSCTYSTVEQFLIPLRGSRHFGLDRGGIAHLLQIGQVADIVALLPAGVIADRRGASRVLAAVGVIMAAGLSFIAFGGLSLVAIGCVLTGVAMAGWMLPLSVLREVTAPQHIAMRTALYRVGVDGGHFLGPFLNGLLGAWSPSLVPGFLVVVLLAVGLTMAVSPRRLADASPARY